MTRKEFLALVAAGAATRGFAQTTEPESTNRIPPPAVPAKKPAPGPLKLPRVLPGPAYLVAGPLLGHVGSTEARIWIRATAVVPWSVQISESPALEELREIAGPALTPESAETGIVVISGLKPETRYYYRVMLEGRAQQVVPLPSFVTPAAQMTPGRLRIAFGSCVGTTIQAASPAWAELAARRNAGPEEGGFDLLLMLGDNHYANSTEPKKLQTYYTAHRLTAGWRELSASVPVYAIWDDHDFGPNDSDGTEPGKAESLRVFRDFWPNPSYGEPDNPGCYFTFTRGAVQFFMLDGRYHRSPDKAPDTPEKTMFGAKQLAWLKRELLASKAPVKILANGSEWETFGSNDSYAQYRHERDAFLAWLTEQGIEGVILLSGDRHFSAGYQVLGRFLELMSSPFGSGNAAIRPNPERFTGYDEGSLWMILDLDLTKQEPAVAYEMWQAGGGLLERRELSWAQVNGKEAIGLSPTLRPSRYPNRPKPAPSAAGTI